MARVAAVAVGVCVAATSLGAQWLNQPTAGVPRTADGKPNLAAPAPRTQDGRPDFSGLWKITPGLGYSINIASDLQPEDVLPWAAALYQQRSNSFSKDDPAAACLPLGPRQIAGGVGAGYFSKVIQTPTVMIILFEDLSYRQVFLDGRTLPDDPNPTFMGYSVGHWEGDTLVIESNGFNERTWLDYGGHPHSEALRFTERWQRKDFGHVELQVTLNDPKAYAKPWTVAENVTLMPDSDLLEFVCNENEKDSAHLRGPAEVNGIPLSREALAALVGDYDAVRGGPTKTISITLRDNQMLLDFDGKGKVPLIPLTDSNFDSRIGGVQFVKDDAGRVTSLLLGGTQRFTRR